VACELSTVDELLLAEMLFKGIFNDLSPAMAASLLSCFVFEEKVSEGSVSSEMGGLMRELQVSCIDSGCGSDDSPPCLEYREEDSQGVE